jgi:hypothetical protein
MGPIMLRWHKLLSVVGSEKDPLQDAIHTGIPSGSSAFDRMANSMSLPYFCLCKLGWASVNSMT